jgi:hypothetical protein
LVTFLSFSNKNSPNEEKGKNSRKIDARLSANPTHTASSVSFLIQQHFDRDKPAENLEIEMAGGKGKSIGGKGAPGKDAAGKNQKSHSAKAGLQVSFFSLFSLSCVLLDPLL